MSMVKIVRFHPERCDGCRDCESACSTVHFKTDAGGDRSAIRISGSDGDFRMHVCDQRGLCLDMCPVGALERRPNGVVTLDLGTCIGCQACVGFCPIGAMRKWEGRMEPFKCISCGACVSACPNEALCMEEIGVDSVREVVYHDLGV